MLNDTSRYLDDILIIDNIEFEKLISDIYPGEFAAKQSEFVSKRNSIDLNMKMIGDYIHTSIYDKRDDFEFPIVNFPWLNDDVSRLSSFCIYIPQLNRFARCCTYALDFHKKSTNQI